MTCSKKLINANTMSFSRVLIFDVLVGKTFINTFVMVMGEMLEFCMWYGGFVKCVILGLCVQRDLHASSLRQ
jgi:hypothetical protein